MKRMIQKGLLLLVVSALVMPLQAKTYLDWKFIEALERVDMREMDRCLQKGANVNLILDSGEMPIMTLVSGMVDDAKRCIENQQKFSKELLPSLIALPALLAMMAQVYIHSQVRYYDVDGTNAVANFIIALVLGSNFIYGGSKVGEAAES